MSTSRRDSSQPLHSDIDEGVMILGACGVMTALACITLVARIYSRGWITDSTDRDDYTMWAAMALSVAGFAVIMFEVLSGAGRYGSSLSPQDLQTSLLLQFISQPLYLWSILLVKVSIVFCLLRFAPSKIFSNLLWGCMIFLVLSAVMYFTTQILRCRPLSMVWDASIEGICFSSFAIRATAYANNAISLIVDLLLAVLPIPMIWNVQIALHVKVAIGFVMSLGALAAAACAIRIHYLSPSTSTGDPLFDSITWTIWTVVECNIAIIAASVPSIIPLIKKVHSLSKGTITSSTEKSHAGPQDLEQGNQRSSKMEDGAPRKGSMQQSLLHDGERDDTKRHIILRFRIDEGKPSPSDSDEDEDISQMYANAARHISKHTTPQSLVQKDD